MTSGIPQRLFHLYSRLRRGLTLGVRAAVFDAEGRIFLVRHSYTPGWYLPGGGVETGETTAMALERELMEEGGIRLDEPAVLFGLYLNRAASQRDHVALYVSHAWTLVEPHRVPNIEIVESGFFERDRLPAGTTDATRTRLDEIAGRDRSPLW